MRMASSEGADGFLVLLEVFSFSHGLFSKKLLRLQMLALHGSWHWPPVLRPAFAGNDMFTATVPGF